MKCLLIEEEYLDIPWTIDKFKKDTKRDILLNNHEINILKSAYNEKYNKNSCLYNLLNNIIEENKKINFGIKLCDIKYIYNKKNNIMHSEVREDKLIFLGTKESIKSFGYQ